MEWGGSRLHHLSLRVQGAECRVQGSGFRAQGDGFRIHVVALRDILVLGLMTQVTPS